jgi:phenylacetate-CoA ligase
MSDRTNFPLTASPLIARLAGLSRNDLEALQLARLRRQLERLYVASPYYRRRMDAARLSPESVSSLEVFRSRFPASDKADFISDQQENPPFGARLSIPRDQVALVTMTGGTSGQGQEIYGRSQRDIHTLGYLHALPWFLAGLRPGDIAINCVPAGGMTTGGWGPGEGFRIAGAVAFHAGGTLSTDAKIDLMLRFPEFRFVYASTNYLHTLTEGILRRGIDPKATFPNIGALFIASEGYPIEWAQRIEAIWGCQLGEGYGSTQCAGFAGSTFDAGVVTEDGHRGYIYLFEWETLCEIVDSQTLEPVRPGEVGELIVTNLSVEGSPVVRFRTGDAVRFISHRETRSGQAWNAIECGTIGRYDDMMKIRGNNVWPAAVDAAVFIQPEIAEYAGRVYTSADGKTEIEVRLAFADHAARLGTDDRQRLLCAVRNKIKERTNVWMTVVEVSRSDLPEFAYKARRWKDERQEGYKL